MLLSWVYALKVKFNLTAPALPYQGANCYSTLLLQLCCFLLLRLSGLLTTAVLLVSGGLCCLHRPVHVVDHFLCIIVISLGQYREDHSDEFTAKGDD
jgi:hypothetical protein